MVVASQVKARDEHSHAEWSLATLEELCVQGGLVRGPFGGTLKKEIFVPRGYAVYEQRHAIVGDSKISRYFITDEKFRELSRFQVKPGDFILSCSGTIGRIYQIPPNAPEGVINQALLKITLNKKIDSRFFLQVFRSDLIQDEILDNSHGGAMPNLVGMDVFRRVEFPLPDINEQNNIATTLCDVDALIENLEALIAKKRDVKTATMQQLLTGKTRVAGFSNERGFRNTDAGEIPSDWDTSTYGRVFNPLPTATNSRSDLSHNADFGYIHYGDIHVKFDESLDLISASLPELGADKSRCRAFLRKGDLVMADASEDYEGIGKSVEISDVSVKPVIAGLHTFLLRDKEQTFVDGFRGYLHLMDGVVDQFRRLATGLKVYGLSKGSLSQVVIPVPSKTEQIRIVEILSAMRDEIALLEQRLMKITLIKEGMMQELLTGRTRLI